VELSIPQRRPRAILFDWDNTLVDSWPVIGDALNTTLNAFGHKPWTAEEVRTRVRKSLRESFPALFGDRWKEAADVFYARYGAIHADLVQPIPGISEMLSELDEMGIYLAVVSNKTASYLRAEADHLGWARYFGQIVGATDAPQDKPAPDPVHMALVGGPTFDDNWNISDIWFVGDTDIDMECAANANCTPILLRKHPPEENEFANFPPVWKFQNGQALCKRLRTL
jgi:phosphoglycolate phosphatase